jgi:DNA-binding PadR family transcriptional regulator
LSPVFRHGSLRLYLLRLLDEEPRHGYEVIRLLRDRFMGVYSPSPGTIYPRLARLEEEGLVTHDEVDGRKVYRITEAGREELRSRSDELDELEEELSASVSDIVREVREDVRQTVRSLREELTWAARESRRATRDPGPDIREQARQAKEDARGQARRLRDQLRDQVRQASEGVREQARQAREQAEQAREEHRGHWGPGDWIREEASAGFHAGEHEWDTPPGWGGRRAWEDWDKMRGRHGWTGPRDFGTLRDLERVAVQFTADLRRLAMQSSVVGENVISDLRTILEEALERIKSEIFGSAPASGRRDEDPDPRAPTPPGASQAPQPPEPPGMPEPPEPPVASERPEHPEKPGPPEPRVAPERVEHPESPPAPGTPAG